MIERLAHGQARAAISRYRPGSTGTASSPGSTSRLMRVGM